jgi:hypothetical protein
MNNPDHNSESLINNFRVKILKFFDADPGSGMEKVGSGMEKSQIRDKHHGSATLLFLLTRITGSRCLVGSRKF